MNARNSRVGWRRGFTLTEMAVVLVIIALIVGSIVSSRTLITGSRLNKLIADSSQARAAALQFQNKYGYPPGDFPTATQVWGRADGSTPVTSNCGAPDTDSAAPQGTCNGDGNGLIDATAEYARAWQQLALAGMLQGNFSGTNGNSATPGVNTPELSIDQATLVFRPPVTYAGDANFFDGVYRNSMGLTRGGNALTGILSGADAYRVDQKLDDAAPNTGTVLAPVNCTVTVNSEIRYRKDNQAMTCALFLLPLIRAGDTGPVDTPY